jgi:zinc D-Ala-D-Ala carboxypeptidase
MKLSEHFSLKEMTASSTAKRMGIENIPNAEQMAALGVLCNRILEPVRVHFDKPFAPSSGFRSVALCEAIGSKATSQHSKGQAADFEIFGIDNLELGMWIAKNLEFDQLIVEGYEKGDTNSGWIHCSFNNLGQQRKQVLHTHDFKSYEQGFPK